MARRRPPARADAQELDSPWKEALQRFLEQFLAFFFPAIHAALDWRRRYQALDKEFQQIVQEAAAGTVLADKLFRVWRQDGRETWLLIHVEIQGQVDPAFPERMFRYNVRAWELHGRTVVSLAVLCDDRPSWRPDHYRYGDWGSETSLRFPVVKVLDYARDEEALAGHANPFAQIVLAHLKAQATRDDPEGRYRWKTRLVRGLYERGWSATDVRHLFRVVDWLMALPAGLQERFRNELYMYEKEKHMPYLSSIERMALEKGLQEGRQKGLQEGRQEGLQEGRQEGLQEGRQEGRQEGLQEGRQEGLLRGLEVAVVCKFGEEGRKLLPKMRALKDADKLEALAQALETAESMAALRRLLR